jgi:aminoglycoside phosphotransferase (APT) family kinase protein
MSAPAHSAPQLWRDVAETLPQFDWSDATFTRGAFHEVAVIGTSTAIRLCTGVGHEIRARREMHKLATLAEVRLTVAVPRVITGLASTSQWSAYGTSVVEGSIRLDLPWVDARTSLAQVLAELATIPANQFGQIREWCGGAEWPERVSRMLAGSDAAIRRAAARVVATVIGIESDAPRAFVHGDFSLYNIVFESGRASGVIDFDSAGAGDPAADLAPLIGWYGSTPLRDIADAETVTRAKAHRATLSLQVAAAADIVGDHSLRDHAIRSFRDRLAAGTLEEPVRPQSLGH